MALNVADERYDWRGPAVPSKNRPLLRRLTEVLVPPKGQKVLPTASGMLLLFVGLTIGLAAYNTENNVLFAALALLIAALIMSGVICWGNMLCARWRLETSNTFRVGEDGDATIVLENARQRFPLFCVSFGVECPAAEGPRRLHLKERLDPGESTRLAWRLKPERRMKTYIRIVDVSSSFPFGFLTKYLAGESESSITVWPARIDYTRHRNANVAGALQGRSSKKKGSSGELIGIRHYESGDAPRIIHWKVSAKQGRLMVKQSAEETQSMLSLVVDPSAYLWSSAEQFEKMCSFAASLAEDLFLESKIDQVFVVGGSSVKIQRVADLETFFDALAALVPAQTSLADQEIAVARRISFRPLSQSGVGAFINDVQIAQA